MDLFSILGACLRRWYITLPLALLVALLSYVTYERVEPVYSSARSIVILPSLEEEQILAGEVEEDTIPENPYSGQGGSRFAVAVLTRNLNSTAFQERLGLDPSSELSFEADSSANQPMIHVEAAAPSEAQVYALLDRVVSEASVVLDEFQASAGAPEPTRYRIAPAVPAGPVEDVTPSRWRAAGALAVIGGALTAALVVGLDSYLNTRRRRVDDPEVATKGSASSTGDGPEAGAREARAATEGRTVGGGDEPAPVLATASGATAAAPRPRSGVATKGRPAADSSTTEPSPPADEPSPGPATTEPSGPARPSEGPGREHPLKPATTTKKAGPKHGGDSSPSTTQTRTR